jgi:hypothetical protein
VQSTPDRVSAAFERRGEILEFSPIRLGVVDTVYTMTIHKSQGSQFETAAVLLPAPTSRILTRELLYTAATRARKRAILAGTEDTIPELLQRAHEAASGARLEVASVDHRRTFCHIDDAVEMIWRASSSPSCIGETLNIGVSEPEVSIGDLAALIATTVGKQVEIVALPPTAGSPPRRCPDMTRTRALIGYDPQVALASGIRETYDWYRRQVFDAAIR